MQNPLDRLDDPCNARAFVVPRSAPQIVRDRVHLFCGDYASIDDLFALLSSSERRGEIAKYVLLSSAVVDEIARVRCPLVRAECARSKYASKETLDVLAVDGNDEVRFAVASNPKTSIDSLRLLACDANATIRFRVACRSDLPDDVRARLCADSNGAVRAAAKHGGRSGKQ